MIQVSRMDRLKPATARGQKTRQKLLEAAEATFGQLGYDGSSVAEITKRAGVAQGTFYLYFPDKRAVFVELVDELGARLRHTLSAATQGKSNRLDVERAGLRAFFEFTRTHRSLYRIVRQAEFVDLECFKRYYQKFADGYIEGLSKAMDQKVLRRLDSEVLAYCLMGISDFLGMRWVLWEESEEADLDRIADQATDFIRHGVEQKR
jgi:AcrR family transcriptional regulator